MTSSTFINKTSYARWKKYSHPANSKGKKSKKKKVRISISLCVTDTHKLCQTLTHVRVFDKLGGNCGDAGSEGARKERSDEPSLLWLAS